MAITEKDKVIVADYCRHSLDLASVGLSQGDYYQSVPVCVVDAVFSIGVHYASTENVVRRFCTYFNVLYSGPNKMPERSMQLSVAEFLELYEKLGVSRMTEEVYQNRQRTSTRGGILKSEAVLQFSQVLHRNGVNYLQDVDWAIGDPALEADIRQIPGQRSGISLRYFYMLAGSDDFIKPDRMISRFLYSALGKNLSIQECHDVIIGAHRILVKNYPALTPKSLDHLIWNYQRSS